jgi:outer membrane murein-binding lipoprotein Lpp
MLVFRTIDISADLGDITNHSEEHEFLLAFVDSRSATLVRVTWLHSVFIVASLYVGLSGCASREHPDDDAFRFEQLNRQVERLNQRVSELSRQLAEQQARIAQPTVARQVDSCRVSEERRTVDADVSVEVELRSAQRALARLIERLELPADSKRELLRNLRPVRALDTDNPWVAAK